MLLEKARLKLVEDLSYLDDLKIVQKFLVRKDFNLLSLSMFEIQSLWFLFSDTRSASFLTVNNDTLQDFMEWLD